MCWRKGIGIHADARCAACRPQLTAAQGPRVEQRAILARTRCATAARLRERGVAAKGTSSIGKNGRPAQQIRRYRIGSELIDRTSRWIVRKAHLRGEAYSAATLWARECMARERLWSLSSS